MKLLSWTLVLPLTVLSFTIFTKWWYVLPVDGPDSMMVGFPFPYACEAWHTSLALQIFLLELCLDILIHFTFWFAVIFCVDRFIIKIQLHKAISIIIIGISSLLLCGLLFIAFNPDNIFKARRNFDIEILKTGYKFFWEGNQRPENFDFEKYEQNKKIEN